jgi:hypothetical protein
MMDPASTNVSSTEQQSPSYALSLQQQQALALQWLEQQQQQQQQEQQQRHSLNQAILVAAAAQQQDQQQPQNVLLPNIGNAISSIATSSTNHHQYLIEMELRRQIMLQQQRIMQSTHDDLPVDNNKALLQERLRQLLSTNASNSLESNGAVPPGTSDSRISTAGTSEVDRIMAAETLLQRNRLQDAIRILQIQGVLQADNSLSRVVNSNHDSNAFATSALLLSNDPITPHNLGQPALTNTNTGIGQLLQPGISMLGQLESKLPRMTSSIDDPFHVTANIAKRKADSAHSTSTKETLSKKRKSEETRAEKLSSFPLPSIKKARRLTMTFKSFQDVWDELETIPLQKEIFIRRLYKYDCKLVD